MLQRTLKLLATLLAAAAFFAGGLRAQSEVRATITAVSTGAETTLGRDETFWVRIQFTAEQPVNLWARPYFKGSPLKRVKTNASLKHSGSGEALGWFSLDDASEVDEVRVIAGGGKPWREWPVAVLPVKLHGTGKTLTTATDRPAWVAQLLETENAAARQAREASAREPTRASDAAFLSGFMLFILALTLGGFAAPLWALWKWDGAWRIVAALPLLPMAFVIARILVDTARDPTSHNLWPFEIIPVAALSFGVFGVLRLLRRFRRVAE